MIPWDNSLLSLLWTRLFLVPFSQRRQLSGGPVFVGLSVVRAHFSCPKSQAPGSHLRSHNPNSPAYSSELTFPLCFCLRGFLGLSFKLDQVLTKVHRWLYFIQDFYVLSSGWKSVSGHSTKLLWVWRYHFVFATCQTHDKENKRWQSSQKGEIPADTHRCLTTLQQQM